MTSLSQHAEWLSLIDISGPFLAEPVLKNAFPQGLEELETIKRRTLRQAYDEWREALDLEEPDLPEIHTAWIDLVLRQGLELDEDGEGDVFKPQADLPEAVCCKVPEHGITLRPDYAVVNDQNGDEPLMLFAVYNPEVPLDEPIKGDGWATSPAERMVELCRASGVRLGLVTNGERWMFVDAPVGAVTTFASWYARLWGQEPKTLQAFVNLLGIRRFFVDRSEQLPALLGESLKLQDEVTEALGEQVRRAVEVLIQALDRADVDRNRELLEGTEPAELYEAGLTVMMRIVFLLSAEERGLLLLGDERYEANYAVSTLRMQLRGESEEILERRWDAWSRLLSMFRAVYGGIEHEALRLPALGGSLFDPDRFPFLEGRAKGSHWKTDPATPLPIDNRTVLLLLDAVQLFQGRTLSYRALDVEQIGYVYEGLLERTVVRAKEVTLDLDATKNAKKPWVNLEELDAAATQGGEAVADLLKEHMGSSASRIGNDLKKSVDEGAADKLLTACQGDQVLRDRIRPYFHLLRIDRWGYPLVYPEGTFMVTTGTDRRETGTHYTPKSLTEAIVKETLEPVVYVGPAEGKRRKEWQLKSPGELLDLKICDPAMGSGAFLVQACRWLSERLVEAWEQSETAGNAVTSEGVVVEKRNGFEPLRNDADERLLTARRLIAERCLYGVDVNPLAVELAKLSIWLVTLAKGRPFGFLDHNLRSGDSLLGIQNLDQLNYLDMNPGKGSSKKLFASKIDQAVQEAMGLRSDLRSRPIHDIRDVEVMASLDEQARQTLELPELIADALVGEVLAASGKAVDTTALSIEAGGAMEGDGSKIEFLKRRARKGLSTDLPTGKPARRAFHWALEFPEVFSRENGGFDAIVGNPPFAGGQKITGLTGNAYRAYLVERLADGKKGSADLVAYFFLRAFQLLGSGRGFSLLAVNTISQGDTREVGLDQLVAHGATIHAATPNEPWPGNAAVVTSRISITKGPWHGAQYLSSRQVEHISTYLTDQEIWSPKRLLENEGKSFQGSIPLGDGFLLSPEEANDLIEKNNNNHDIINAYLSGNDILSDPGSQASRWVIDFGKRELEECYAYPDLIEILERRVKPVRAKNKDKSRRENWWRFTRRAEPLYKAIEGKSHVLFHSFTSKYVAFAKVISDQVFAGPHVVIASDSFSMFSCLQSSIYDAWARTWCSTHETRLRFAPSDLFETCPFPLQEHFSKDGQLSRLGRAYCSLRSSIMQDKSIGLTKLYNLLHTPTEKDSRICELRSLHRQIDKAVLSAYGWDDLELGHDFHEVPYLPDNDRIRFTISEVARLEVLKRLSDLNKARFEDQEKSGSNVNNKLATKSVAKVEPVSDDLFNGDSARRAKV